MAFKRLRAWILPVIMLTVSLAVIGVSLGIKLLDLDTYKEQIIAGVRASLNRELRYESGEFSLRPGPGFTFTGVRIKEKDGVGEFVRADRLTIGVALWPLLQKRIVLNYVELDHPVLNLSRDEHGVLNVNDLLEQKGGETRIEGIKLKQATVNFTDRAVAQTPVITGLTGTDLAMTEFQRGKECHLNLKGTLNAGGRQAPVSIGTTFKIAPRGVKFTESFFNGKVQTGAVNATHFLPYYGKYLPFRYFGGDVATDFVFRGKLNDFKSKGSFQVTRLYLDYPKVFHAVLAPRLVKGSCELELTPRQLNISNIKANVDGLGVAGTCRLVDLYSRDIRIVARASTTSFNLQEFRQYIPYGIIVKDTADFIEQKLRGGIYKLDDARLDGRVSQILHMERGRNYNVLTALAHVQDGLITYGGGIPTFNAIKGELELAGKDFNLKGMSGRFGSSPFTLNGSLADFPLDTPTLYPFVMNIHPRQPELAWLLGAGKGERLAITDNSQLKLTGSGSTRLFNLKGDWDLTPAAYQFRGALAKPAGRANSATFQMSFSAKEFILNALNFRLAPLDLAASARYRYGGGLALEIRTNNFAVGEVAPLAPQLAKYHPAGKVQATLHGRGKGLDTLGWDGELALAGVSLKPSEKMKPLTALTGNLRFGPDSAESSQLSGRIGNSTFHGKGSVTGFKAPALALNFTSPSIDLSDLGMGNPQQPVRAERVSGNVTYRDNNLQIAYLGCQLGHSLLALKGSVQDLDHPRLDLQVNAPHLELEDLSALNRISSGKGGAPIVLKASVAAVEGKGHDIPFKRLRCTVLQEDGILYLQGVEAGTLDGELTGKVRLDPGPAGQARYQVSFALQRASAEKLLHALGVKKQELTGKVSVSGELTAKGESSAELRKTALGSISIRAEHGTMRRFSVLSKVFSILNVSQLLKFHLPDMVSGGMPYKKITGDIAIRDGVASTTNLFVDSEAINISTVGKIDLVRNELDLTIGVQPLQTVDKVVSKIPIVGWILTGKDKSLVTTYFEAKGPVEDPKVTAVPVKSLAKGVFNIFKRVFELPARLITDTGEVVIGK
ncbi:YhdP family protein [Geomesophilobacter sediminis]|uniref:AsmA-like C-terminal domain-containing protein n=1 Tax=Geomesophilobacter sediminis TaxID=2798584 RepID=A0A8J7J8F7_9BACT|nr:AsmA-like C-terminal domain-containing protein [Geomesophilobacter sediminis]MBJ6725891.1 AsmA-like C-terminal domain-containing protein [Geomesophilobacter sediminis]